MPPFETLPPELRTPEVRPYYEHLAVQRGALRLKRIFDLIVSLGMLLLLLPLLLLLAVWIRLDSPGPVIFRQTRVGRYGRPFTILKFRTMRRDAERLGPQISVGEDPRISRAGRFLRRSRLDELPQLLNILRGDMSFVGVRPEVPKYVARYTPEMRAVLLLRPGVTSPASIRYKDEAKVLAAAEDPERVYVREILPDKMSYDLGYLRELSFAGDLRILLETVIAVLS